MWRTPEDAVRVCKIGSAHSLCVTGAQTCQEASILSLECLRFVGFGSLYLGYVMYPPVMEVSLTELNRTLKAALATLNKLKVFSMVVHSRQSPY